MSRRPRILYADPVTLCWSAAGNMLASLMRDEKYIFRIDRFTPDTLPMSRLAEYLAELANLLGFSERVHFKELRRGSVQVVSTVESEAMPKVRGRLQSLQAPEPPEDVRKAFQTIDNFLERDNAVGSIRRGSATILKFAGRERPRPPRIGPFTQPTEIIGQLVRIGGRDESAHGTVVDAEGRGWLLILRRDQARELARHLYGSPIRVSGGGRWTREQSGAWVLEHLRVSGWEQLSEESLRETITQLRGIQGLSWSAEGDPAGLLQRIRHGEEAQ